MKYFRVFWCIIAIYSSSQQSSLASIYICKNKNESEIRYWWGLFYYGELQTIYCEVYCISEMYLYSDVRFTRIYGLPLVAYFCHLELQCTGTSRISSFLVQITSFLSSSDALWEIFNSLRNFFTMVLFALLPK